CKVVGHRNASFFVHILSSSGVFQAGLAEGRSPYDHCCCPSTALYLKYSWRRTLFRSCIPRATKKLQFSFLTGGGALCCMYYSDHGTDHVASAHAQTQAREERK
ncbi:unnamed protein product, partial [Ectocarpus sp. 12 AP-2014]